MSPEGDHDIWCLEHTPPIRCEVERRVDERISALAPALGRLMHSRDYEYHTQDELLQLQREIESIRNAMVSVRITETIFEEHRRKAKNQSPA